MATKKKNTWIKHALAKPKSKPKAEEVDEFTSRFKQGSLKRLDRVWAREGFRSRNQFIETMSMTAVEAIERREKRRARRVASA